jgi:probable phosphoglycerate mutase
VIERLLDGRPFTAVYTSPLKRARDTAALALGDGIDPVVCEELREYQYGDLEGLTPTEIREQIPGWDIWRDGCPNGESTEQVGDRADAFLERCTDVSEPVAAFSHGHMIRILGARALGLPASSGQIFTLSTAAVCVIKDYHGKRCIAAWNWTGDTS